VSGVLPRKDYAAYYGADAALLPGQLIECVVTKPAAGQPQARGGGAAGGWRGRRARAGAMRRGCGGRRGPGRAGPAARRADGEAGPEPRPEVCRDPHEALAAGSFCGCAVPSGPDDRKGLSPRAGDAPPSRPPQVVQVTVSHDAVATAAVKDSPDSAAGGAGGGALTLGGLLPGMLVAAKVRSVLRDGLAVTFLTYFSGEGGGGRPFS
jgi:hypothetical protein